MNHDEKFQQIWDFRRRDDDDDGDSSDDSRSHPSGVVLADNNNKRKLDLVLLDNAEVTDTLPTCQKLDTNNGGVDAVEPAKKKIKTSKTKEKKKTVVRNNKSKSCSVKEKNGKTKNLDTKEAGMFEDLKIFANSLIDGLRIARENMFAHMKAETKKFVAPRTRKKKVVRSNKKNKTPPLQNGTESIVKPQNCFGGSMRKNMKNDPISKAVEPKSCENLHKDTDQVVSSSQYLTLPTVVPKPQAQAQAQSQRNIIRVANGDKTDETHVKQIDPRKYYHGVPGFQQELFRSFSNNASFLGQSCSQVTNAGVGFTPMSVHQVENTGSSLGDGSSTLSSQSYSENVFLNKNSRLGMRMNAARFPVGSAASSESILRNNRMLQKDGDVVPLRSQEMKDGQFFPTMRNNKH